MRIFSVGLFILFACSMTLNAQSKKSPIKFEFEITEGNTLHVKADVKKGWNIYSHYTTSGGPIPSSISLDNASAKGKLIEEGKVYTAFDDLFEMEVSKFKDDVTFVQKFENINGDVLKGYFTYMSCDDKRCLPPEDVIFEIPVE